MTFIQGTHRPVLDGGTGLWNEADTGFLANFQATMADDELRLASNGVENELEKRWNANAVAFKKATGGNLQEQMIFRNMFLEAAREAEGKAGDLDDDNAQKYKEFKAVNDRLIAYKAEHPEDKSVSTFNDMWGAVKEQNLTQRKTAAQIGASSTIAGDLGSFSAGIISSLNPNTNFFNFATLGIGGFGKSMMMRIFTEAGAGGAIETINQFTGVAERQELLGTPTTTGQKLAQVGMAAVGAGGLRGAIEGVPALARVVEGKVAPDRALGREMSRQADEVRPPTERELYEESVMNYNPERAPTSSSKAAMTAEQTNIAFTRANPFSDTDSGEQLHWEKFMGSVEPIMTKLRDDLNGSTRMPFDEGLSYKLPDFDEPALYTRTIAEANRDPRVIALARETDPQLINRFDELNALRAEQSRWLDDLGGRARDERIGRQMVGLEDQINELKAKSRGVPNAKQQRAVDELEAKKAEATAEMKSTDTPDMARIRAELVKTDVKLRDMSEEVSAAFKTARDEMGVLEPRLKISPDVRPHLEGLVDRKEINKDFPLRSIVNALDPHMFNGVPVQMSAAKVVRELDALDEKIPDMMEAETKAAASTIDEELNTVDLGRGLEGVDLDTRVQRSEVEGDTVSLREYLLDEAKLDDELVQGMTVCAPGGSA